MSAVEKIRDVMLEHGFDAAFTQRILELVGAEEATRRVTVDSTTADRALVGILKLLHPILARDSHLSFNGPADAYLMAAYSLWSRDALPADMADEYLRVSDRNRTPGWVDRDPTATLIHVAECLLCGFEHDDPGLVDADGDPEVRSFMEAAAVLKNAGVFADGDYYVSDAYERLIGGWQGAAAA